MIGSQKWISVLFMFWRHQAYEDVDGRTAEPTLRVRHRALLPGVIRKLSIAKSYKMKIEEDYADTE